MAVCERCNQDGGDVYWENDGSIEGYYCEHCANHLRARYQPDPEPEVHPCELCGSTYKVRSPRDPCSNRIGYICQRCTALLADDK